MLAETTTTQLSSFLPQIALVAAISILIGWALKGHFSKPKPSKATTTDHSNRDRTKTLEAALEKSKAAHKELKAKLETLETTSVPTETFEKTNAELESTRKTLDTEAKRISTLETDLKKAQDTIKNLNARANDADKAQKDRSFTLENELSQARQKLAQLEAQPDDSAVLHAEIERLRESVAVSSRFAGEVRKREAAAVEALEKAQAELAALADPSNTAAKVSKKIGPVVESDRVAAAKAEVLRLIEKNKQAPAPAAEEIASPIIEEFVATEAEPISIIEEPVVTIEEPIVTIEEPVVTIEEPIVIIEEPVVTIEEPIVITEEPVVTIEEPTPITEEAPPAAIEQESPAHEEVPAAQKATAGTPSTLS